MSRDKDLLVKRKQGVGNESKRRGRKGEGENVCCERRALKREPVSKR